MTTEHALQLARPVNARTPDLAELARIAPGCRVKLTALEIPGQCVTERFWVWVLRVEGDTLHCEIGNPVFGHGLKRGQQITAKRENVYRIAWTD